MEVFQLRWMRPARRAGADKSPPARLRIHFEQQDYKMLYLSLKFTQVSKITGIKACFLGEFNV